MSGVKESGEAYTYRICSFLVSSASGLFQEPDLYGPLRLLQAFSMIVSLSDYVGGLKQDEFLLEIRDKIDREVFAVVSTKAKEERTELVRNFVNKLCIELAGELKRRKIQVPGTK